MGAGLSGGGGRMGVVGVSRDGIVRKLRARPGRGGVRLSGEEAQLLLLLLRERGLTELERVELRAAVDRRRAVAERERRIDAQDARLVAALEAAAE